MSSKMSKSENDIRAAMVLSDRIAKVASVAKYDSNGERESDRIVNGLFDIVGAAKEIEKKLAEPIVQLTEPELIEWLTDILDELRHIDYHIKDMRHFQSMISADPK